MKKFNFRMQKLLECKKSKEEELIKLMAVDTSQLYCANKSLAILLSELDDTMNQMNEVREGESESVKPAPCNPDKYRDTGQVGEVMNYYSYASYLKEAISNQKKKINITEMKMKQDREKLISAMKERKILEKLKENQYKYFVDKYNKLAPKEMDEIAARISSNSI